MTLDLSDPAFISTPSRVGRFVEEVKERLGLEEPPPGEKRTAEE